MGKNRPTFIALIALGLLLAGGRSAAAAIDASPHRDVVAAPELVAPADGSTLSTFGPTLRWSLPPGSTQYQLQVTPVNNDGPGVNLLFGGSAESFTIPAPPDWYGLLPDMSYSWRLRASDAESGLSENDSGWGTWSTASRFRTPSGSSGTITPLSPAQGGQVDGTTPTLTWSNGNGAVYYYEIQVSKDPAFGTGSFLYWELRHGGVTNPRNSYTIPAAYPLETGATYHWRVRPRVQGDGMPVDWTAPRSFTTRSSQPQGNALLEVTSPQDGSSVTTGTIQVTGRTRPGAFVTVNEVLASVDQSGNFRAAITLRPGPNELEILASDLLGNTAQATITVTYITP